jgi:hypothetical protein
MTDKAADIHELWPQLLQAVKNRRRFIWILLSQHAKVLFYDGTALTLSLVNQGVCDNPDGYQAQIAGLAGSGGASWAPAVQQRGRDTYA